MVAHGEEAEEEAEMVGEMPRPRDNCPAVVVRGTRRPR